MGLHEPAEADFVSMILTSWPCGLCCHIAEHSSVGETYREAVVRGLSEELGIQLPDSCLQQAEVSSTAHASIGTSQQHGEGQSSNVLPRLWGPLTPTHKRTLVRVKQPVHECMRFATC